ncbi:metal-dependent hydrolase [Azospirillum sp. YIM DDC1]|uniref:Metal-dependent hydrolase n=1 Tax=Azospirillum aestuarii TaxID=2802052 RepID=A0ABS1I5B6_9PROT|nr:metal-dependent hydrolase [Azospirillum aestuarii]MBK4721922.1 metal-dependent hydrolase [Azospirillum aestuarii]
MDTVTQMLLGATVAQAGFRRRLGRRALAVGAGIALIPDLDVAAGWIGGPFANWVHHRGLTHSILFGPFAGLLLGWLVWRWQRRRHGPDGPWGGGDALRAWIWLAILALMTHPVIDVFTSYGTQWLYPLTDTRFAINAMPIIDPIYSLILLLSLAAGVALRRRAALAQDIAGAALILVSAYTLGGWAINDRVEAIARAQIGGTAPAAAEVTAYPTLFQPLLRRVVAETPDAVLVGFHSVLSDGKIQWERFERNSSPAIEAVAATPEAKVFRWFSMDNLHWREQPLESGNRLVQALDHRYGMPGVSSLGFWGIRAVVDPAGRLAGPVETFQTPRDASRAAWQDLWVRIVGTGPADRTVRAD